MLVHRKGATRAFPPGHSCIPEKYRGIGQPVIIGGSMGTCSYVLTGTEGSMRQTFGSTCHGAGREMSRSVKGKATSQGPSNRVNPPPPFGMTRSLNSGSTVQNFPGVVVIGGGSFYLSCMCHCEQGRGQACTFPTIPERVLKAAPKQLPITSFLR